MKTKRRTGYTEFRTGVTVWSLEAESDDQEPCAELLTICRLIQAEGLAVSPTEIFPRAEPLVLKSATDPESYVSLDLSSDPTDQMEVVGISIVCPTAVADAVYDQVTTIRDRSEVKTALLRGDLGLPAL